MPAAENIRIEALFAVAQSYSELLVVAGAGAVTVHNHSVPTAAAAAGRRRPLVIVLFAAAAGGTYSVQALALVAAGHRHSVPALVVGAAVVHS